eukprot:9707417-Alexandrium_andersonii.AAC.1
MAGCSGVLHARSVGGAPCGRRLAQTRKGPTGRPLSTRRRGGRPPSRRSRRGPSSCPGSTRWG